jgi:hypothetical protein
MIGRMIFLKMKTKRTIFDWAKISLIIEAIIEFISRVLKIPKDKLWPLVDEIQRELYKRGWIDDTLNEYVIKTPELLDQRVKRDVDKAIENYEKLEEPEPVLMTNKTILKEIESGDYTEEQKKIVKDAVFYEKAPDGSNAQSLLGGEMGIRGHWVNKD